MFVRQHPRAVRPLAQGTVPERRPYRGPDGRGRLRAGIDRRLQRPTDSS